MDDAAAETQYSFFTMRISKTKQHSASLRVNTKSSQSADLFNDAAALKASMDGMFGLCPQLMATSLRTHTCMKLCCLLSVTEAD